MKSLRRISQLLHVNSIFLTLIVLFFLIGTSAFAIQLNDVDPFSLIPGSIEGIAPPIFGTMIMDCDFRSILLILIGAVCGVIGAHFSTKKSRVLRPRNHGA